MSQNPISAGQSVRPGIWTDHNGSGTTILFTDFYATMCTALVAVLFTLAGPYLGTIAQYYPAVLYQKYKKKSTSERRDDIERRGLLADDDQHSTLNTDSHVRVTHNISKASFSDSSPEMLIRRLWEENQYGWFISWPLKLVYFVFVVAYAVASVFSAGLQTDRVALWASSHCGVWRFDSVTAGEGAATRADVYDREKEARAGEYARDCYESSSRLQSMYCDVFYQPNISFTTSYSYQCPFPEGDHKACTIGSPSVTFDTGQVDASKIGVNDQHPYKFRRRATCSALSVEEPYVKSEDNNGTTLYHYYYGQIIDEDRETDYMHTTRGNPFESPVPVYDVSAYATSWYPDEDYWRPMPELTPPENSTLTLLFISPLRIFYPQPSTDPIFPADKPYYIEDDTNPWYYKSDPVARVLACIDYHELCSPDGQECWSMTEQRDNLPPSYWLMKLALEASNTYDSISWRLGTAIIAQEMVSQFTSAPLPSDHWVTEAKRLFATSLARIQFDAWNIASGEDFAHEGAGGYVNQTPDEAGDLCNLFKFKSMGYHNINLKAFLLLVLSYPLTWLLSRTIEDVPLRDAPKSFWACLWAPERLEAQTTSDSVEDGSIQREYGTWGDGETRTPAEATRESPRTASEEIGESASHALAGHDADGVAVGSHPDERDAPEHVTLHESYRHPRTLFIDYLLRQTGRGLKICWDYAFRVTGRLIQRLR